MVSLNVLALLVGGLVAILGFVLTWYGMSTLQTGDNSGHIGGWTLLLIGTPCILLGYQVARRAVLRLRHPGSTRTDLLR